MSTEAGVQKKTKAIGKRGRKLKLTETLIADVCKYRQAGVPGEVAFECLGIGRSTYYEWKAKAKAGEQPYAGAFEEFQRAESTLISALANRRIKLALKSDNPELIYRVLQTLSPELFPGVPVAITANVKSESTVSGTVEHQHNHAHTLTVQGADAIRREILLGGKPLEQARDEFAQRAGAVRLLPSPKQDVRDTEGEE